MSTSESDPYADVEVGDDDPIGPFDEDNICGELAVTYLGKGRQMQCLREPHPDSWVHVSACDDAVDFVWRDLTDRELQSGVMTPDGLVCRDCGCHQALRLGSSHFAGCPQLTERAS